MKFLSLIFLVLIGSNIFIWQEALTVRPEALDMYFLNIGQGDSSLVTLPDGAQILIDGGPDKEVLFQLAEVLPETDRYIDLIALTHPQMDHFGGLTDVLERYEVGAFLTTGREGDSKAWEDFKEVLIARGIPIIVLEAGDEIRQGESTIHVLSPNQELLVDEELNESSLVFLVESEKSRSLFTGDAGFPAEDYLLDAFDMNVDILKVGHHGSRFSTSLSFLEETTPEISVIQVGENRFGHPTQATISRLASFDSQVFRNDTDGRVHIQVNEGVVGVFTQGTSSIDIGSK